MIEGFDFVQILDSSSRRVQHWLWIIDSDDGSCLELDVVRRFPRAINVLRRKIFQLGAVAANEAPVRVPFSGDLDWIHRAQRHLIGEGAPSHPEKVTSVQSVVCVEQEFFEKLNKILILLTIEPVFYLLSDFPAAPHVPNGQKGSQRESGNVRDPTLALHLSHCSVYPGVASHPFFEFLNQLGCSLVFRIAPLDVSANSIALDLGEVVDGIGDGVEEFAVDHLALDGRAHLFRRALCSVPECSRGHRAEVYVRARNKSKNHEIRGYLSDQ